LRARPASLVGHRRGADVTASDRHPLTAHFLAENLRLNGLPPMKYLHGDWDAAGDDGAAGPTPGGFDLIVGSDLLYERDAAGTLAGFVSRHAKASCEVWIVDPDRSNRPAFNRRMDADGFARHEERLDVAATATAPPTRAGCSSIAAKLAGTDGQRPRRRNGRPPVSLLPELLENNRRWAKKMEAARPGFFSGLLQAAGAAILCGSAAPTAGPGQRAGRP
jgi:hypothetical protein